MQLKANQKKLLQEGQTLTHSTTPNAIHQTPPHKNRNRIETRRAEVFHHPALTEWPAVQALIKMTRTRQIFDTKTKVWQSQQETSYYLSTIILTAPQFEQAIRSHWTIENREHYVRDVTLGEDRSRIRPQPHIWAKLRSLVLNLLRQNHVSNVSHELFLNSLSLQRVLQYVGIL